MKKTFLFILSLICLVLFSKELPKIQYEKLAIGTEETFEVMTWNIQNFPKTEFTINYSAKIINAIDPDLIGLQEIQSDSAFFALIDKLNDIDTNNWSGYRANTDKWKMNLAYIYKTEIIKVQKVYEIYDGDYHAFPRRPLVMEFEFEEEPFVIINNHLKAKSGEKNRNRRIDACQKLEKFIADEFPNTNVILLGDLNDQISDPEEENVFQVFLDNPDKYKFADQEIAADSTADWSYPYWKYRGHIDHILISNELFDEFENSEVKTITIDKFMEGGNDARYKYITDHRPVVLKMGTGK